MNVYMQLKCVMLDAILDLISHRCYLQWLSKWFFNKITWKHKVNDKIYNIYIAKFDVQ